MKKTLLALTASAALFGGFSAAQAETTTGSLTVEARLTNGCTIDFSNGGIIKFDNITDPGMTKPKGGDFGIKCTTKLLGADGKPDKNTYTATDVALSAGTGTDGDTVSTVSARFLSGPTAAGRAKAPGIPFQVYKGRGNTKRVGRPANRQCKCL